MDFCPNCGSLLEYSLPEGDQPFRFSCPTCPYVQSIESGKKIVTKVDPPSSRKKTKSAGTSREILANWPRTGGVRCPHCGHGEASYKQSQTGEKNGTIYRCMNEKCEKGWRDD